MPVDLQFPSPQVAPLYLLCDQLLFENRLSDGQRVCLRVFKEAPNRFTLSDLVYTALVTKNENLLREVEKFVKNLKGVRQKDLFLAEVEAAEAYLSGDKKTASERILYCFRRGYYDDALLKMAAEMVNPAEQWELTAWLLFYYRLKNPQNPKISQALKTVLLGGGERSVKLIKEFIKIQPSPDLYRLLGDLLLLNGRYKEAVKVLEEGVNRYPADKRLRELLSQAYIFLVRKENFPPHFVVELNKVIHRLDQNFGEQLERLADENPKFAEILLCRAVSVGWTDAAVFLGRLWIKNLKEVDSKDIPCLALYWGISSIKGIPLTDQERQLLEQLLKRYPKNPYLRTVAAFELAREGKRAEAAKYLEGLSPQKLQGLFLPIYYALRYYLEGLKPPKRGPYFAVALITALNALSPALADKYASEFLEKNPSPEAYELVVDTFFGLGKLNKALDYARRALELFPDNPYFLNTYAYTLLLVEGQRGAREAATLLKKALAKDPNNPAYEDSLGYAYLLMGNLKEAQRYLSEALKQAPNDPAVEYHYALLLLKKGDCATAEDYAEKALKNALSLYGEPEPQLIERIKALLDELKKKCRLKR